MIGCRVGELVPRRVHNPEVPVRVRALPYGAASAGRNRMPTTSVRWPPVTRETRALCEVRAFDRTTASVGPRHHVAAPARLGVHSPGTAVSSLHMED